MRTRSRLIRTIMDDVRLGKERGHPGGACRVTSYCRRDRQPGCDDPVEPDPAKRTNTPRSIHWSVSILTVALGRHWECSAELIDLGICGLLHDVGKGPDPDDEVLDKAGAPFTVEEMRS